jgi:hypothetical protein
LIEYGQAVFRHAVACVLLIVGALRDLLNQHGFPARLDDLPKLWVGLFPAPGAVQDIANLQRVDEGGARGLSLFATLCLALFGRRFVT